MADYSILLIEMLSIKKDFSLAYLLIDGVEIFIFTRVKRKMHCLQKHMKNTAITTEELVKRLHF